jgi:hypothetical protein
MEANLSRLTRLQICYPLSARARDWTLKMLPQMQLEDLDIKLSRSDFSWDDFTLKENTLKSLTAYGRSRSRDTCFVRTFVATQWHSLTSLRCHYVCFAMDHDINLPNLRILGLICCRVNGWAHLCNSVTMLERLELRSTKFMEMRTRDILSALPSHISQALKSLFVKFDDVIDDVDAPWFSAYASSFTNLREFRSNQTSVATLTALLTHCTSLETLRHSEDSVLLTAISDAHLKILSEHAPTRLWSVILRKGHFSPEGLAGFVNSLPISVKYLQLEACHGLTPPILRAMSRLPLRELKVEAMEVQKEHYHELELISKNEIPSTLKFRFYCYYDDPDLEESDSDLENSEESDI